MDRHCTTCGMPTLENGQVYACRCDMKRPSKYRAKGVKTDEGYFHSQSEYTRWKELKHLQHAGGITNLKRQVPVPLYVNGKLLGHWVADFTYTEAGKFVAEDHKGFNPPLSAWKLKHVRCAYPDWEVRISKPKRRK